MNENIIVPPSLHPLLAGRNRGRGRPYSNNRKKTLDKGVYCCFFCNYIIFFTVQKGRNIYRGGGGGGGGVQLFIIIFFFGGGGVQILISIETYITCDFSGGGGGGGGVRTTYPSLDSRMGKK